MIIEAPATVDIVGPLVFLAGPIAWGPASWQDRAIAELARLAPAVHVANPRRDLATSAALWNRREDMSRSDRVFPDAAYDEQMDWETRHLHRAAEHGVVMFWLAREVEHRCERPHAQTTRFELAEWKERHRRDGAHLVVGIEEGFTGARYIRRRFEQDCPGVPLCSSLEETCRVAVERCAAREPSRSLLRS